MDKGYLEKILESVSAGSTSVEDAVKSLKHMHIEDIDYAHIDHHRAIRKGFPEVIFGEGKTAGQIVGIMEKMAAQEEIILVTRADKEKSESVLSRFPDAVYHEDAKMIVWKKREI
ncbi:MAG: 1-(5-phosphoribosyl)-5-amino-4-imidazole-carboxylate carboxylase, partial [Proteobacteria bacterium]|nr:1-(5-phosphoribosyl)-5-amino-4-imidazole-carboxylate carboxylase [Pseudomonadota bacterium]